MRHHAVTPRPVAFAGGDRASLPARVGHFALDRFLLLPFGAAIALVWANTAPESYFTAVQNLRFAVNDIAMALFFGLITQEIIEEVMPGGALQSWRRWTVPLAAGIVGTVGAAVAYLLYVDVYDEALLAQAWPAACAVDIVAAYYILKALGMRRGIVGFAMLTGIVADGLGLAAIASRGPVVSVGMAGTLLIAAGIASAAVLRQSGVRRFWPYLFVSGTLSWVGFFLNGLQPALALIPIVLFLPHEPRRLDEFPDTPDDDRTHHAEHEWAELVQVILFLFGIVNAGVILRGYGTGTWALVVATLVGRPLGALAGVATAVALGLHLPRRVGWGDLVVAALATSGGFTVALFFAVAVVPTGPMLAELKIGALSMVAGALLALAAAFLFKAGRFAPGRERPI